MMSYIKKHVIVPPEEMPQTLPKEKLMTFTKHTPTNQTQNSKVSMLSKVVKAAFSQLQKACQYISRAIEYPLAICDEYGKMRHRNK